MGDLNAKVVKERKDNSWKVRTKEPETSAEKKNVSSVVQQTIK